jgi:hypothetical protein
MGLWDVDVEMLMIPRGLDYQLTDGGKFDKLTHPESFSDTHFC